MRKNLIRTSLVIILTAIILFLFLIFWLKSPPPSTVDQAENAVATNNLILLSHINNERINTIINSIGSDPNSLDIPLIKEDFFSSLYYGQAQLKEKISHVTFGIQATDKMPINHLILQGSFQWQDIQASLANFYQIASLAPDIFKLTQLDEPNTGFVCPDDENKQPKSNYYLFVNQSWLIISSNEQALLTLRDRVLTQQSAEIDLSQWREYRNQQLASMAILLPSQAPKAAVGFTGMMIKGVVKKNKDIQSVYVGFDLNLLQQGLNLNSQINATPTWAKEAKALADSSLAELKGQAEEISPTLASFIDNFSIHAKGKVLSSQLALQESDLAKLSDVFSEVMTRAFSFDNARPEEIEKESLLNNPWDYAINRKFSQLEKFKVKESDGIPAHIDGPIAVSLSEVSVNNKTQLLELEVKGKINTPKIDGWWSDSKAELALSIDSITDHKNQNMLRDERCDKTLRFTNKNHEMAKGFNTSNEVGSIHKRLRLKKNSQFKDIASINGKLDFSIPSEVHSIILPLKKGENIEKSGVRFYISKFTQQSLTYELSGNKDRVIEVRALNDKGQALSFNYSTSMGNKKTVKYRGDIAQVQVLIAKKYSRYSSRFNITAKDLLPEQKINDYYLSVRPTTFGQKQWQSLYDKALQSNDVMPYLNQGYMAENKIASTFSAPHGLLLTHDNSSQWSYTLRYLLGMPLVKELAYNLQAFEIQTQHANEKVTNYFPLTPNVRIHQDRSKGEYLSDKSFNDIGYLKKSSDIKLAIEPKEKITRLTGNLTVNLPKNITTLNVGKPGFATQHFDKLSVTLQTIDNGFIPRYEYKVSEPNLITMIAVLDNGKELLPSQASFEKTHWKLTYPLTQKISHFEVLIAKDVEQVSYPFTLSPNYQNAD